MSEPYIVSPFGLDCLGNASGYMVARYIWRRDASSKRADGLLMVREVAGSFVADLYVPGSHAAALASAEALCRAKNSEA
jgi:hypothetical protein